MQQILKRKIQDLESDITHLRVVNKRFKRDLDELSSKLNCFIKLQTHVEIDLSKPENDFDPLQLPLASDDEVNINNF